MLLQFAAAEIITVPGETTSLSLYFCFMERESFPVGILIPKSIAKLEHDSTASYSLASSPGLLQGHIQLADSVTDLSPLSNGAQMILVSAFPIAFLEPALGSIKAEIGE